MEKTNYNLLLKSILPIIILLVLILLSEIRTQGDFGGLIRIFKLLFFFFTGLGVIIYALIKNIGRIRKNKNIREAKMVLIVLSAATIIGISSFWFPYDFFDPEPDFVALDQYGTKLTLTDSKYVLKTMEIEWTSVRRGEYTLESDTIILDISKERFLAKRAIKYLINNDNLIPIYSDGIEKDSTGFLKIVKQ